MKPTLCSRCKKNVAVVFITRLDPNGQNSHNEGLCLKCARELNIRPVTDMIEKMGLSDEELEGLTNEMMYDFDGTESMQDLIGNITEPLRDVAGERDDDEDEEEEPEPEEDELLPSFSSILARVFAPTTPSAVRPFLRWKSMTAASVLEPKWPLTVPV